MKRLKLDNGYVEQLEKKWNASVSSVLDKDTSKRKLDAQQKKNATEQSKTIWNDLKKNFDITNNELQEEDEDAPKKRVQALNAQLSSIVERVLKHRKEVPKLVEDTLAKQFQEHDPVHTNTISTPAPNLYEENQVMMQDVLLNIEDNLKEASATLSTINQKLPATITKATQVQESLRVVATEAKAKAALISQPTKPAPHTPSHPATTPSKKNDSL